MGVGRAEVAGVPLESDGGSTTQPGGFAVADDLQPGAFARHHSGLTFTFDGGHVPLGEGGDIAGNEDEVGREDGVEEMHPLAEAARLLLERLVRGSVAVDGEGHEFEIGYGGSSGSELLMISQGGS